MNAVPTVSFETVPRRIDLCVVLRQVGERFNVHAEWPLFGPGHHIIGEFDSYRKVLNVAQTFTRSRHGTPVCDNYKSTRQGDAP